MAYLPPPKKNWQKKEATRCEPRSKQKKWPLFFVSTSDELKHRKHRDAMQTHRKRDSAHDQFRKLVCAHLPQPNQLHTQQKWNACQPRSKLLVLSSLSFFFVFQSTKRWILAMKWNACKIETNWSPSRIRGSLISRTVVLNTGRY